MTEEWRDIPGWEGLYQASSEGRIRSLDRVSVRRGGTKGRFFAGRVLKQDLNPTGYMYIGLKRQGRRKTGSVHRMVARAFLGEPPTNHEAAHIDGDSLNNRAVNLRWSEHIDNIADTIRHGKQARWDKQPNAKLSDDQVQEVRAAVGRHVDVANSYGVSRQLVGLIKSGRYRNYA